MDTSSAAAGFVGVEGDGDGTATGCGVGHDGCAFLQGRLIVLELMDIERNREINSGEQSE